MYNTEEYDESKEYLEAQDLEALREKISADPWNQELYTEAIRLASTQNDLEALDYFKKQYIEHGTPDDSFWLAYIEERRGSATPEELVELYRLAVKNQPSVYIWLPYLRFVFENSHSSADYEALRELFESSLDALGLHALDGPQLWSEYRRFEQELLSKVPKDEYEKQLDRVRSLFYRQLRLPLAGLPDLLDEYLVWERELPSEFKKPTKEGELAHKKGFDAWEMRKFFELKIQSDFHEMMSRDKLNSLWNDYIDFELKVGDMPRIMMVYHRALDDLGFERDDLWISYANYALQTNYTKSVSVCERAYRHMPRSLNIWINYFLVVASKTESPAEILELLDKSTSAVRDVNHKISLHITAADCVRRIDVKDLASFRKILSKCWNELDPEFSSRSVYRLLTYWSKYELKLLSFNVASEYTEVVAKLLQKFKKESFCWLYLIDAVKRLDPENPHISMIVREIHKGFSSLVQFNSEFEPKSLHLLIVWLYELAMSVVNANEVADEYIDYVQTSGVVEDIKRAHKVAAAHTTPTSMPDNSRPSTLSLNNILRRERRRKLETFSETSSDSGSYSSLAKRTPYIGLNEARSPWVSLKDGEFVIKSPKLSYSHYHRRSRFAYWDPESRSRSPQVEGDKSPKRSYHKTDPVSGQGVPPELGRHLVAAADFDPRNTSNKDQESRTVGCEVGSGNLGTKDPDSRHPSNRSPLLTYKDPDFRSSYLYRELGLKRTRTRDSDTVGVSHTGSDRSSLSDRDFDPRGYYKDHDRASRLTLKDVEILTRATWDGCESADPSIAPRVPPNAPMPPPSSPVLSRVSSRQSYSGSCSPDLSPEMRFAKFNTLPPPLVLISDSNMDDDYKLNYANIDSESNTERLSSDNESQLQEAENTKAYGLEGGLIQ